MTEKDITPNEEMRSALPAAGKDRWWKVELVKNVEKNPIKVTLFESQRSGTTALSSALGFARCDASIERVKEAAEIVLIRVADYNKVIGEYV